ncbi:hypothetical protein PENSPDRAFT_656795 [Peniophora sp. CONT]|nr:hypothetical protein PENSPDRAFT_656795 [Peniophora sp. CONT]
MDYTLTIPDETLGHIFSLVQSIDDIWRSGDQRFVELMRDMMDNTPASNHNSRSRLGWLNITFVGRRWRQVALEDATLWTHPTGVIGQRWLGQFVQRSKSAPLFVDDEDFFSGSLLRSLLSIHSTRINTLRLGSLMDGDIEDISHNPFDTLEKFSLAAEDTPSHLLDTLLDHSPRLLQLSLYLHRARYSAYYWNSYNLNNLTFIKLALEAGTSGFLTPQFLDALRHMGSLIHLVVSEINGENTPISCSHCCSATAEDLITLERLESMAVRSSLETHAHLLRHIRIPLHARLALIPYNLELRPSIEVLAYEVLSHKLNDFIQSYPETPTFNSASLIFKSKGPSDVIITVGLAHATELQPYLDPTDVEIDHKQHPSQTNNLLLSFHEDQASDFLTLFSLQNVRALSLLDAGLSDPNAQLPHFPNVEFLRISNKRSKLLHGLHLLEEPTLLPKLRHLDLDRDSFNLGAILACFTLRGPGSFPDQPTMLDSILRARQHADSPLEAIYLHAAEEVALVKAGRIDETSCRHIHEDLVLQSVLRLEAIKGVQLVDKNVDVFSL